MKTTKSGFSRMTITAIKQKLGTETITLHNRNTNGEQYAVVAAELAKASVTPDRATLVDMVLKARNQSRADSAHVRSAEQLVDSFYAAPSAPVTPTAPISPATPAPQMPAIEFTKPKWLGNWSGNATDAVANIVKEAAGKTAVMIPYNIPNRDLGSYSAGGLGDMTEYKKWVDAIALGAGNALVLFVLAYLFRSCP